MSLFLLSQIFAGLTLCSDIISFQMKKRDHILACLICSSLLLAIHFVLLSLWTAAAMALFAGIRYATSLYSSDLRLAALFLCCIAVITVVTWQGPISLLAACGTGIGTIAAFMKSDKRLRQLMFGAISCWLCHNIIVGSPGAVIVELVFMTSNITGYLRHCVINSTAAEKEP